MSEMEFRFKYECPICKMVCVESCDKNNVTYFALQHYKKTHPTITMPWHEFYKTLDKMI